MGIFSLFPLPGQQGILPSMGSLAILQQSVQCLTGTQDKLWMAQTGTVSEQSLLWASGTMVQVGCNWGLLPGLFQMQERCKRPHTDRLPLCGSEHSYCSQKDRQWPHKL